MKVCIKEDEFNPSLLSQPWCDEKQAIDMGYTIVEAPEDCVFEDFDGLQFNHQKYINRKQKTQDARVLQQELNNLLLWFESYDNQVKQFERCVRLNIEFDKDIVSLDKQAKNNANRITEIRKLIF